MSTGAGWQQDREQKVCAAQHCPNLAVGSQVILWVLGEYGSLADIGPAGVLRTMGTLAEEHTLSDPVRGYLLSAVAKLAVQVQSSGAGASNFAWLVASSQLPETTSIDVHGRQTQTSTSCKAVISFGADGQIGIKKSAKTGLLLQYCAASCQGVGDAWIRWPMLQQDNCNRYPPGCWSFIHEITAG